MSNIHDRALHLGCVFAVLLIVCVASAQIGYFPHGTFSKNQESDRYWSARYSECLTEAKEAPLSARVATESYRLLLLRAAHEPIVVRIDIHNSGNATVVSKVLRIGNLATQPSQSEERTVEIKKGQVQAFLKQSKWKQFWKLRASGQRVGGPDGSHWLIEGYRHGKYRAIDAWSPKTGVVRSMGMTLLQLSGAEIPAGELY